MFITVSLGGSRVLAIFPIPAGTDEKAIRAAPAIPTEAGRRIGDALVIRLPPMENQSFEIRPSQRPELTAAFEAAGDGAAQGVLIPPAYTRRVIEELMPQLPKEIGGGPSRHSDPRRLVGGGGDRPASASALHLVIKSQDASAAEAFRKKWAEVLRLAGQHEEVRRVVPQLGQVAPLLTPKVEGDRLILTFDQKTAAIDTLVAAIEMPLQKMHSAAQRSQSLDNLKQIALAMHNYIDMSKHFPAAASCGPNGKPLLSGGFTSCLLSSRSTFSISSISMSRGTARTTSRSSGRCRPRSVLPARRPRRGRPTTWCRSATGPFMRPAGTSRSQADHRRHFEYDYGGRGGRSARRGLDQAGRLCLRSQGPPKGHRKLV